MQAALDSAFLKSFLHLGFKKCAGVQEHPQRITQKPQICRYFAILKIRDIFCAYSVIYCIQCIFRDIYCVYSVIYTVYIPWYILCIFRDIYCVYFVINTAYIPWENCAYSVIYTRIVYIPWYILRIFRDIYCVYLPFSVSLGRITRIYCSLLTSTHLSLIFFLFAQQIGYLPILLALDVLSLSGKENNQGRGGWGCPHEDMRTWRTKNTRL